MECPENCLSYLQNLACLYDHNATSFRETTTFDELGMDSYEVVDFLLKVEEKFDVVIADEEMLRLHTMKDVLDIISEGCKEELSNA